MVTGSADKSVRLWAVNETKQKQIASPIIVRSEEDTHFAISDDHHWLATIGGDYASDQTNATVQVWDLTSQDPAYKPIVLRGHKSYVFALAFSPDNRWLATGSYDQTARLWNLADPGADPVVLSGHTSVVDTVAFSPDNRWLITGSFDGTAGLWRITSNGVELKPAFILRADQSQAIFDLNISADSHWLVTSGNDQTLTRLWDLTATNPAASSVVLTGAYRVAISPDSHWLVTTGKTEKTARLWNLISRESRDLPSGGHPVAFSQDHHWLVTGGGDARLWDLTAADSAAAPFILPGSQDKSIKEVVFSPNNQWLVTGNEDHTVRVWNLKEIAASPLVLKGHTSSVDRLAISSNSHWLATGSYGDKAVRVWDLTSNNPADSPVILSINGRTSYISFSNESNDSHWLVTGNYEDDSVLLWNLRLNELKELACRTAGRNLSEDEWRTYFPGEKYHETCPNLTAQRATLLAPSRDVQR